MKVLLAHNYYQQAGGEDQVFADEGWLLESNGHQVLRYTVHNDQIKQGGQLSLAVKTIWNRSTYAELRELFRREQPAVVHFQNTFPLISPAAYYAARAEGVAVVQEIPNYRLLCPNAQLMRDGRVCEDCVGKLFAWPGVVHKCYRNSRGVTGVVAAMLSIHKIAGTWTGAVDTYIALTQFTRGKLIQGGLPAEKIEVKGNFLHPDPGPGTGDGGYAVFVGRLSPEKGVRTLLAAWELLGGRIPLKILGDGPLASDVRDAAARISGIEWLGRRPLNEVLDIVGRAAMLVFPSQWYEGQPKTIIEALAKGTPVVGLAPWGDAGDAGPRAQRASVRSRRRPRPCPPGRACDKRPRRTCRHAGRGEAGIRKTVYPGAELWESDGYLRAGDSRTAPSCGRVSFPVLIPIGRSADVKGTRTRERHRGDSLMMHTVYYDSTAKDDVRRSRLYDGQLFVFSPKAGTMKLIELARGMIEEAFGKIDPREAQYHMPVEKYVEIVAPLKPKFIHHPETKKILQGLVAEFGCDMNKTYIDVPRLRMVTSDGYLTSGVGYAHHPHRDTWYSAPMCQINWWLPIYDIETEQSMAFHPAVLGTSRSRTARPTSTTTSGTASAARTRASRSRPTRASSPSPRSRWSSTRRSGSSRRPAASLLFSAAHLHSTVPNNSGLARYSIDFRTVNLDDVDQQGRRARTSTRTARHVPARFHAGHRPAAHARGDRRQVRRHAGRRRHSGLQPELAGAKSSSTARERPDQV